MRAKSLKATEVSEGQSGHSETQGRPARPGKKTKEMILGCQDAIAEVE